MQARGLVPNYEASTSKMFALGAAAAHPRTGIKVFGLYGKIWDPDEPLAPLNGARFTQNYVHSVPS